MKQLECLKNTVCTLKNFQTDEHFTKIWILVTKNCLEIEDVLKFDSLEACEGKKATLDGLAQL